MNQEPTEQIVTSEVKEATAAAQPETLCSCGRDVISHTCHRCQKPLCLQCSYREEVGTLTFCRDCANQLVGVCDVCDALHARPCGECGQMVCEAHQKRVIERWGWGGIPGQGGVMEWFPILRTYCQEHGQKRLDWPKPTARVFKGIDGSSPEW